MVEAATWPGCCAGQCECRAGPAEPLPLSPPPMEVHYMQVLCRLCRKSGSSAWIFSAAAAAGLRCERGVLSLCSHLAGSCCRASNARRGGRTLSCSAILYGRCDVDTEHSANQQKTSRSLLDAPMIEVCWSSCHGYLLASIFCLSLGT